MSGLPIVPLTEMVDIHDSLRKPVSQTERNKREGPYPYFGATGQVGWIDDYRQEGKYVLLGEDGAPFLDPLKPKAYIVEGKCWVNNHAHVLKGKDGICDDEFLCFALNWADYSDAVTGSTRLKLPQGTMNRLLIPKPPIKKQCQIAARLKAQLAEVDKARQAAEAQLRDACLLRSRVLKGIFSEQKSAQKKVLGDHAACTSGSTPARGNKQYWQPAEIPWVKTAEVVFNPILETEEAISKTALNECSVTLLPPETVLIAMYGQGKTRGQSAILKVPVTTNQACFAILPNDTWEPEFLFLWLKSLYQDLRALSEDRGGNQANLNGGMLKALNVPAPDKTVQLEVVERIKVVLTEIDNLERASKVTMAEIEPLPNKLLAQAFEM